MISKRPYSQSLRGKITNRSLVVGILPVLLLGGISYFGLISLLDNTEETLGDSREILISEVVGANLENSAVGVAKRLDEFMIERISDVLVWASSPVIINASRDAAKVYQTQGLDNLPIDAVETKFTDRKSLGLYTEAEGYLKTQLRKSVHFAEIFTTDINGYNVALTNPTSDFVQRDESWWTQAFENGISVGEVEYDKSAGVWSIDISVRITDLTTGYYYGVMKSVLSVTLIQEVATERAKGISGGNITILNDAGLLLAETSTRHAINRIMNASTNLQIPSIVAVNQAARTTGQGYLLVGEQVIGYATSAFGEFYDEMVPGFSGFNFQIITEQPSDIAFSSVELLSSVQHSLSSARQNLLLLIFVVATFIIALSVVFGVTLSNSIVRPIGELQVLVDKASRGDISSRIEIRTNDEIEDLAQIADRMRTIMEVSYRRYQNLRNLQKKREKGGSD